MNHAAFFSTGSQAVVTSLQHDAKKIAAPALLQVFNNCKLGNDFLVLLGKTLRRAANSGLCADIQTIFESCNPEAVIDLQDENPNIKNTALHYAIDKQHIDVIELLLKHGAKIDIENVPKNTQLMLMQKSNNPQIVKIAARFEKPKTAAASPN